MIDRFRVQAILGTTNHHYIYQQSSPKPHAVMGFTL